MLPPRESLPFIGTNIRLLLSMRIWYLLFGTSQKSCQGTTTINFGINLSMFKEYGIEIGNKVTKLTRIYIYNIHICLKLYKPPTQFSIN